MSALARGSSGSGPVRREEEVDGMEVNALQPCPVSARRYCDLVWQQRPGWVVAGIGAKGHFSGTSYKYVGFRERPYRWPDERNTLVSELLTQSVSSDVFVTVMLRSRPSRKRGTGTALPGQFAWLDADPWDDERNRLLVDAGSPVHRVSSGGPGGGEHVYVDLGEPLAASLVGAYCQRLAKRFDTDNWGGDNKFLRLPGTFNHKGRAQGRSSAPVRWLT